MKAKSIIGFLLFLLAFGLGATSCEDMLTPDMTNASDADRRIEDTVFNYLGIMRSMQQVAEQNVILGEARGDLVTTTSYTSDSIDRIANFRQPVDGENLLLNRAAYYNVINHCNFYLAAVDSTKVLNYNYLMKKEVAQVILIRAWAYMQLVQNYGRVPFITVPVTSAGTGWETDPAEGWVSLAAGEENLLNRLYDTPTGELWRAYEYERVEGLPNYGSYYYDGQNVVSSKLTFFHADIIMAELYLLCAQTRADYEKAAEYYYRYFTNFSGQKNCYGYITNSRAFYSENLYGGRRTYSVSADSWVNALYTGGYTNTSTANAVTFVPSAASTNFGLVLKRIPEIYGFELSSSTSTSIREQDDAANDYVADVGAVNVQGTNYKKRQLAPSEGYISLNEAQPFAISDDRSTEDVMKFPEDIGDARLAGAAPLFRTEEGRLRFVQKFCPGRISGEGLSSGGNAFRYCIPLYTTVQLYLHFAEAINRAGFPRYAFAILHDGLNYNYMPDNSVVQSTGQVAGLKYELVSEDEETHTRTFRTVIDSVSSNVNLSKGTKGANYISPYELVASSTKSWLDFSDNAYWNNILGIHEMGCGLATHGNTEFTYENVVEQRIADEALRSGLTIAQAASYARRMMDGDDTTGDDPAGEGTTGDDETPEVVWDSVYLPIDVPTDEMLAAQINAVETLIADEAALALSFEGFRYYDLMRMARHKNLDSYLAPDYGSRWMAWLIARRNLSLKPYEQPANTGDGSIYNLLSAGEVNWYLASPY